MPDHEIIAAFPSSQLPHVGTYRRVLPVSLVRMYENTLDWEHLPFVHDSSFSSIECLDAGPWGWRAITTSPRGDENEIELTSTEFDVLEAPNRRSVAKRLPDSRR